MDINHVRALLPGLIGFTISGICQFSQTEARIIDISPPGFVFGIVWPILYIIIGYAWLTEYTNKYVDSVFLINTLCSGMWLYLFNCRNNKRMSLYLLLVIIATSLMMIQTCSLLPNRLLLCCYTTWLLFAMLLNSQLLIISNN
jgi:translocator protein